MGEAGGAPRAASFPRMAGGIAPCGRNACQLSENKRHQKSARSVGGRVVSRRTCGRLPFFFAGTRRRTCLHGDAACLVWCICFTPEASWWKKLDARAIFGRKSRMCLWKSFFVDVENRGSQLWKVLPPKVCAKRRNDAIEWLDSLITVCCYEKNLGKQGAGSA